MAFSRSNVPPLSVRCFPPLTSSPLVCKIVSAFIQQPRLGICTIFRVASLSQIVCHVWINLALSQTCFTWLTALQYIWKIDSEWQAGALNLSSQRFVKGSFVYTNSRGEDLVFLPVGPLPLLNNSLGSVTSHVLVIWVVVVVVGGIRWWSEKFSASTIDGNTIGKIFFPPKLVRLS